jgi:hypothetical protein
MIDKIKEKAKVVYGIVKWSEFYSLEQKKSGGHPPDFHYSNKSIILVFNDLLTAIPRTGLS